MDGRFADEAHLRRTIDKIVGRVGRRVDEASPMVDARLPDGSRVNAIIPPLAVDGSLLTIRKFATDPLTADDLISFGTVTRAVSEFLSACVRGRLNILVSGGTGAGKTTTLNVLSGFIPEDERVITIEDAAELQLHQEHVLRLEARPPNIEGKGEVRIRDLVRNALRMRPDRIVVGEIRDAAALDMLQAMNTGHDGSVGTVHANGPRDVLSRVETMVLMAGVDLPIRAIREQVASAVDLIVHQARLQGRHPAGHARDRGRGHGGRHHHPAGPVRVRPPDGPRRARPHARNPQVDRAAPQVHRQARGRRRPARPGHVRLRAVRPMTAGAPLLQAVPTASAETIAKPVLVFALVAFFLGCAVLIATVLGAATRGNRPEEKLRRRLSFYTLGGREVRLESRIEQHGVLGSTAIARSAVELAERVTKRQGLSDVIDVRLEAAGIPMRTPEWLVVQILAAVGLSLLFLLLSSGAPVAAAVGLLLGLGLPWLLLTVRQGRRENAFLAQLPDTLQMLAGSLQAGYSLPQAIDTVAREGQPPVSAEFNRALVESRLGMPVEDALEGIAGRMASQDFSWVVMAVRIQRDVGGNLAELLLMVADTLRERERLRRQVRVLSAEGRLSGWILGALPVLFFVYLAVANPTYLAPMWSTSLGIAMIVLGLVLLVVGAVWLTRVVKVEV